MNDRKRIEAAQAKLQERIDSISARLIRARGLPLVSSVLDDGENRNLELSPGQLQFFDEKWKETLEKINAKKYDECLNAFMRNFEELNQQKVDLTELPEKSDRSYVDSLIDEMNESVADMLNESVHQKYEEVHDQLLQAEMNLDTIQQQFEQSMEMLRKDLIRFKKQLVEPEQPFDPKKITQNFDKIRIQTNSTKKVQCFPLCVPLTSAPKPRPIREKYRPKSTILMPNLPPIIHSQVSKDFVKLLPRTTTPKDGEKLKNAMEHINSSPPRKGFIFGSL